MLIVTKIGSVFGRIGFRILCGFGRNHEDIHMGLFVLYNKAAVNTTWVRCGLFKSVIRFPIHLIIFRIYSYR